MADMRRIYDFAAKWYEKFHDPNIDCHDLLDHFMADDCDALGFKMDCGHAFAEKYGEAVYDGDALSKIIDDVTDIPPLGSAIYARWRYFSHWAYVPEEILEPKNRWWFILALNRLAVLSGGNSITDTITRITLDYHRVTKIKPAIEIEAAGEFIVWDYTEHLIIDRETDTLEYVCNMGTGCKVSHKYEIDGGIESLLENFDAEKLFLNVRGNPDDVVELPDETKKYRITVEYTKNPSCIIEGSYDKNGLPDDFAYFAETVLNFIDFYGIGEIVDPSVYGKRRRRKSEYIFCSVTFNGGYKSYYYLTDDDSIEVGDYVIVSAGEDNHEAVVRVVNIEYFDKVSAPLPVEKTKWIIRKCEE